MQVMKQFNWDVDKNKKLIEQRGISFEEIVFCIENDNLLDIVEHPNKEKYESQMIFVVKVSEYVYLVPFVENEIEIFLKTIIPSRKAMKKYTIKKDK